MNHVHVFWSHIAQLYRPRVVDVYALLALSGTVDLSETNVLAVVPSMHRMILIFSSVIGSRKTNVMAVIPYMHGIIFALSGIAGSIETNVLPIVLGMHGT